MKLKVVLITSILLLLFVGGCRKNSGPVAGDYKFNKVPEVKDGVPFKDHAESVIRQLENTPSEQRGEFINKHQETFDALHAYPELQARYEWTLRNH